MSQLTQRDNNQIERHEHDEMFDAKRVYIVGGGDIKVTADTSEIANSIKQAIVDSLPLTRPEETPAPRIIEVERPIIITEIKMVEVEKPIVIKEQEIVYVDRPVVVEKIVYKESPIAPQHQLQPQSEPKSINLFLLGSVLLQTLTILGIIIKKL